MLSLSTFVDRLAPLNEGRMPAVYDAFAFLLNEVWPATPAVLALKSPASSTKAAAQALQVAFDEINATAPTAAFWWKDQDSVFFGCCRRLGPAAGLPSSLEILNVTEGDPRLGWARQGNLYRRDDREVLSTFKPKLEFLERQDRDGGAIVWLRTSKAPYKTKDGALSGTVGCLDVITDAKAQELLKKR